ncbi:hypothetical protein VTK26DRAFT_9308 [Humicola hyalothermophila]
MAHGFLTPSCIKDQKHQAHAGSGRPCLPMPLPSTCRNSHRRLTSFVATSPEAHGLLLQFDYPTAVAVASGR